MGQRRAMGRAIGHPTTIEKGLWGSPGLFGGAMGWTMGHYRAVGGPSTLSHPQLPTSMGLMWVTGVYRTPQGYGESYRAPHNY